MPKGRSEPPVCLGVFDQPSDRNRAPSSVTVAKEHIFDARATCSFDDYERRFKRLHQHMQLGDCYQAILTFPVPAQWFGDALDAFDALIMRQPVKYGTLVSLDGTAGAVAFAGTVFEINGEGWVEITPMKGTTPRGKTPE